MCADAYATNDQSIITNVRTLTDHWRLLCNSYSSIKVSMNRFPKEIYAVFQDGVVAYKATYYTIFSDFYSPKDLCTVANKTATTQR